MKRSTWQCERKKDVDIPVVLSSARGDTFVFAEDDDDSSEGTTQSPGRSAGDSSSAVTGRPFKSPPPPVSDFNHRQHQQRESTLQMTRPPLIISQRESPVSHTVKFEDASATAAPTTAETTTAPTTAPTTVPTTAAPDPDAKVCSGRPFDSFMQLKNGSTYAFRGA